MTVVAPKETIRLTVLDSILYGAARAFEYLGMQGQVMLTKIGEGILDYCLRERYVEPTNDPQQLVFGVASFFTANRYVSREDFALDGESATLTIQGYRYLSLGKKLLNKDCYLLSCPMCLAQRAAARATGFDSQLISIEVLPDGSCEVKFKVLRLSDSAPAGEPPTLAGFDVVDARGDPDATVGLPIFEAVEYGLARGFEYLGAQAQLLLDNVGHGVIEFLRDEHQLKLPPEPAESLEALSSFYVAGGLADKIETDVSSSEISVAFENYRYASVLRRLLDEDLRLVSCPFTLASRMTLRKAGLAVGDMRWKLGDKRNVILTLPLQSIMDQQFDEDKVSSMMDAA